MMKKLFLGVTLLLVTLPFSLTWAAPAQGKPLPALPGQPQMSWLGVALDAVPLALSTQLSDVIPAGQGVLVQSVSPDSPAAQAGLKKHDVLLSFGDQKLYSPQQLSGLIRSVQPGSTVTLKVVQQGKLKDMPITIGQRAMPQYRQPWGQQPWSNRPLAPMPPALQERQPQQGTVWDSFESWQVNTLPDGRYRASVSFKAANGEEKSFTFEGKREEIVQQIKQHPDIPQDKKQALLNALNMRMGDFFNQPFFRGNIFDDPFFRHGFGQDPFFQRGFPVMPDFRHYFQNPPPSPVIPELQSHGDVL